jgi:hypothetical protein
VAGAGTLSASGRERASDQTTESRPAGVFSLLLLLFVVVCLFVFIDFVVVVVVVVVVTVVAEIDSPLASVDDKAQADGNRLLFAL